MKQNNLFKTVFLLLAMVGGTMSSWADNVSIPQDLGNYINWSKATTNASAEHTGDADGGNLGSTGQDKYASFTISNITKQDYIVSFRSSSNSCEANWSITLTNSSSQEVLNKNFVVTSTSTDNWGNYSNVHSFLLSSLPADTYTLTLTCTSVTSGNYGGNLKYLAICKASDYANLPLEANSEYLSFANGTATTSGNPRYVPLENTIGWIPKYTGDEAYPNNAFLDGYFVNNTIAGRYNLKFFLSYANNEGNKAKVKVTITDVKTGNNEIDGVEFDVTYSGDNKTVTLPNPISTGMKKIRFDFACKSGSCNFKNVTFAINKYVLSENEDYSPIAAASVDVELTRTITADKWSTICLPFDMTADQVTTTFGSSVKLAGITGYDSGNKQITTAEATTITANEPCFIKVASNFTSATINNVTIATGTPEKTINGDFKLVGTYSAMDIPSGCYFVSNNNLYKSTGSSHIKPFRAYFTSVPSGARIMFWDDEDVTAVTDVRRDVNDVKGEYYDLQGRKVANPTKGLYIVNGKKVIIR